MAPNRRERGGLRAWTVADFLGESLIFLISQPRAGSTLLQRILGAHPLVESCAEPWLMLHPIYALRESGLQAEYNARLAYLGLQDFLDRNRDGRATYISAVRAFADVLYEGARLRSEKRLFLDKTPRYYYIVPELQTVFPNANFVFLLRNPLSVLRSILATWVRSSWPSLSAYHDDLLLAPKAILDGMALLGNRAHVVHYENLVTYPVEAVRELCNRLDLRFTDEMLVYGHAPIPSGRMGDSTGIHQYDRPVTNSRDLWRELAQVPQTSHFAVAYLDELGADLVNRLGYSYPMLRDAFTSIMAARRFDVVPWDIAIRPDRLWTHRERLIVNRAMAIQERGVLAGMVRFTKSNFRALVRSLLPD